MSEPLLTVEDLHAYYGPAHVLQGVSFEIGDEPVAIVGRNGMGKTTLCAAIMGIKPPRATGSIRVRGSELRG
jgi:branched-chain amino acid transport system ATP-binding protein